MLKVLQVEVVAADRKDKDFCIIPVVGIFENCTLRCTLDESWDGDDNFSQTGTTDALSISIAAAPPQKPGVALLSEHVQESRIFPRVSTAEHTPIKSIDSIVDINVISI